MKRYAAFPVKVLNERGVVISRHHSINNAEKKHSLYNLHPQQLNSLRKQKIVALGDKFMVPYSLTRDEIMALVGKYHDSKINAAYKKEIHELKSNYKRAKDKTSSFIAVLNKDFTIKYIWEDSTVSLADKLGINYNSLKASLCKFNKNKKAYLNGTKKRQNDEFYVYLKDLVK